MKKIITTLTLLLVIIMTTQCKKAGPENIFTVTFDQVDTPVTLSVNEPAKVGYNVSYEAENVTVSLTDNPNDLALANSYKDGKGTVTISTTKNFPSEQTVKLTFNDGNTDYICILRLNIFQIWEIIPEEPTAGEPENT